MGKRTLLEWILSVEHDLTTKRCLSKVRQFSERLCALYEKAFPSAGGDDTFWTEVDAMDDDLAEALNRRPLGNMDIDAALTKFGKRFKQACVEARSRVGESGSAAAKSGPRAG